MTAQAEPGQTGSSAATKPGRCDWSRCTESVPTGAGANKAHGRRYLEETNVVLDEGELVQLVLVHL